MTVVRNITITTVRPDIPNYQRMIYGQYSVGIEPMNSYYERKLPVSEKTFESVKQDYIDRHGLKDFGVWLGDEATPELLEQELNKIDDLFAMRNKIDRATLLEAKIERYEEIIRNLGRLGQTNVRDFVDGTQSEEVSALKRKILEQTTMALTEKISHDIEYAKKKGIIE